MELRYKADYSVANVTHVVKNARGRVQENVGRNPSIWFSDGNYIGDTLREALPPPFTFWASYDLGLRIWTFYRQRILARELP